MRLSKPSSQRYMALPLPPLFYLASLCLARFSFKCRAVDTAAVDFALVARVTTTTQADNGEPLISRTSMPTIPVTNDSGMQVNSNYVGIFHARRAGEQVEGVHQEALEDLR